MAKRRGGGGEREAEQPLPLEPVDLLAGLPSGVELEVDDLPAGVAGAEETTPVSVSVNEVGRLLRSGDPVIRRLIRTPRIEPGGSGRPPLPGAPPRDPDKPGE